MSCDVLCMYAWLTSDGWLKFSLFSLLNGAKDPTHSPWMHPAHPWKTYHSHHWKNLDVDSIMNLCHTWSSLLLIQSSIQSNLNQYGSGQKPWLAIFWSQIDFAIETYRFRSLILLLPKHHLYHFSQRQCIVLYSFVLYCCFLSQNQTNSTSSSPCLCY